MTEGHLTEAELPKQEVSHDIVYQEMYEEMRRYRDFELTVSTWHTTILLGILAVLVTGRFAGFTSSLSRFLASSVAAKSLILVVAVSIGASSVFLVCYSWLRYRELRNYVSQNLEPLWKEFKPKKRKIAPRHLIIAVQVLLVLLIAIVTWWRG